MKKAHSLLYDRPFSISEEDGSSVSTYTLPGVLARLSSDRSLFAFSEIRPHQESSWHVFLTTIAACALAKAKTKVLPTTEAKWLAFLLDLTGGNEDPWYLLNELDRPAFYQPPEDAIGDTTWWTPDDCDTHLMEATNFGCKIRSMTTARVEHWVFALVSTNNSMASIARWYLSGARVPGSGRVFASLGPDASFGSRFVRDVHMLLDARNELIATYGYAASGGVLFPWTMPWDRPLFVNELDPCFLDLGRRLRLVQTEHRIVARAHRNRSRFEGVSATSLGDPWLPVKDVDGKLQPYFMCSKDEAWGFAYNKSADILTAYRTLALRPRAEDGETPLLRLDGIGFDRGKVTGYWRREVVLTPGVSRILREASHEEFALMSGAFVKDAQDALGLYVEALDEAGVLRTDDKKVVRHFKKQCDTDIDFAFYPALFEAVETGDTTRTKWRSALHTIISSAFDRAVLTGARNQYHAWVRGAQVLKRFQEAA